MFSNKKGIVETSLVQLLVLLAGFAVVFFLVIKSGKTASIIGEDEACRISMQLAAASKKVPSVTGPAGTGRPYIPLNCPRKDIILSYNDVVENNAINQEKAHEIIAEEMYKCWNKLGEGKIDPFSNWDDLKKESLCLICGAIKFDDKLKRFIENNANKLNEDTRDKYLVTYPTRYLMEKTIPLGPNKGKTYFEYLWNEKPPKLDQGTLEDLSKAVIFPNSLILINMYKKETKSTTWKWVGYGVGAALIVVGGVVLAPVVSVGFIPALLTQAGWIALGKVLVTSAVSLGIGGYTLSSTTEKAFSNCPECNGIGGIVLLPSDASLQQQVEYEIDGKKEKMPLCTILVN